MSETKIDLAFMLKDAGGDVAAVQRRIDWGYGFLLDRAAILDKEVTRLREENEQLNKAAGLAKEAWNAMVADRNKYRTQVRTLTDRETALRGALELLGYECEVNLANQHAIPGGPLKVAIDKAYEAITAGAGLTVKGAREGGSGVSK